MTDFEFEEISEAEVAEILTPKRSRGSKPKFDLTVRNNTTWFKLPHIMGFCTVPMHDEIMKTISDDEKKWRQNYPSRMTYFIEPYHVCRDCFTSEADIECRNDNLPALEFA